MKKSILYTGIIAASMALGAACSEQEQTYKFLIGTYTEDTESRGIYICRFNMAAGTMELLSTADDAVNPSYVAFAPDGSVVYSVNEAGESSAVTAFRMNAKKDSLLFVNDRQSPDIDPCYVAVSPAHVITAGYTDGCIAVYERASDGSIGNVAQTIYHSGKSVNRTRQKSPHIHQVVFTRNAEYLLVCDLGTDRITTYKYDAANEDVLRKADSALLPAGSGIRHLALNAQGNMAYVVGELDGSITAMSVGEQGHLEVRQRMFLAADTTAQCAAAVKISPDGKFLYATNRCEANTITAFAIAGDGLLSMVGTYSTNGAGPRDFSITQDGKYIVLANQLSDNIVAYERDVVTGTLKVLPTEWKVPAPVCVVEF